MAPGSRALHRGPSSVGSLPESTAMPLENPNVIDMISTPAPGQFRMVIKDTGNVPTDEERLQLLEQKLETYVNHLLSPEFGQENPDVSPENITISIVTQTPPTKEMKAIETASSPASPDFAVKVEFSDAVGTARARKVSGNSDRNVEEAPLSRRIIHVVLFLFAVGGCLSAILGTRNIVHAHQTKDAGVRTVGTLVGSSSKDGVTGKSVQLSYSAPVDGKTISIQKRFRLSSSQFEAFRGKRSLPLHYLRESPRVSFVGDQVEVDYLSPVFGLTLSSLAAAGLFFLIKKK